MKKSLLPLLCVMLCLAASAAPCRIMRYYDGANASYFEDEGNWEPVTVSDRFEYRELVYDKEARALDYRVLPRKDGIDHELIYWRPAGILIAQKVIFRMRNLGTVPVYLSACWVTTREGVPGTTRWYGWNFPGRKELPADGAWHDIAFDADPAGMTTDEDNDLSTVALYRPQGRLDLYFEGTAAGVETHVQLAEIRSEDEVASSGKIQWESDFPQQWSAGETLTLPGFRVKFQGRMPYDPETRLVLRPLFKGTDWPELPIPLENIRKEGDCWSCESQSLALTPFLLDGDYHVTLECGEAVLEKASFRVKISGRKEVGFRKMEVKPYGGRPTIWKDDQPMTGAMRATYTTEGPEGIRKFSECGIRIFGFCSTPTEGGYNLEMLTEYAPGKYNYQQFDRRMRNTLAVNPDAMLIVRLYLHAPRWWAQEHPEEMVWVEKEDDPTGTPRLFVWNQGRAVPSWASRPWREYTKEGLRKLMKYLSESPYADHIAGFVLASGTTEEWMEWGFSSGVVADYSPASERAFREWLSRKYGTDQALQAAWRDSGVSLSTATQPSAYQRIGALEYPGVMDPEMLGTQRIADYNRYHAENVSGCIAEFCQTIKEATDNHLLAGAFYGYFVELSGSSRLLMSGHLGVGKLLEDPNVDYLCSPTGYNSRQTGGEGMPYAMGAADSLQIHNKFWFIENDIRTSATKNSGHGCPENVWGDVLQHTKESMHNLLTGMAQWWFDVGYIRFVDKEVWDCIRNCVEVMDATTLEHSREPVAQVALVIDEESIDWTTPDTVQVSNAARGLQKTLSRMGAPYEVYLSRDLANLPERIRVLVLPMSLCWDEAQKAALDKWKSDGRVIFFLGTPGIIPPAGMTREESARALTGLPLSFTSTASTAKCEIDAPDGEWIPVELSDREYFSGSWKDAPARNIQAVLEGAPEIHVLGHYLDRTTNRVTAMGAMGVQKLPEAWVLFSGVTNFPRELLEHAYSVAGVHRYLDTPDQVWATRDVFAVCVKEGGEKMLRLPRGCRKIRDMISGEAFAVDAEGLSFVPFLPLQTRVFLKEQNPVNP